MPAHFDTLELRDPAVRERDLFLHQLPAQVAHAKARAPAYAKLLACVEPRSVVTRAAVKADVLQAAADGTLQRTDYDDAALIARRAKAHTASATFAQRVKTALSHSAS